MKIWSYKSLTLALVSLPIIVISISPISRIRLARTHFYKFINPFLKILIETKSNKNIIKVKLTIPNKEQKISPLIYGLGSYLQEDWQNPEVENHLKDLNFTFFRYGGNTSERYNFKNNSWNIGHDWFFRNIPMSVSGAIETFITENSKRNIASSITIPMLGWVAKDSRSSSFPRTIYPQQDKFENELPNSPGNGLLTDGSAIIADPFLANVPTTAEFFAPWILNLKKTFENNKANKRHYITGNEPMLWNSTHRDVHPAPATYQQVLTKFLEIAKTIRSVDSDAIINGPALWGFLAMHNSAYDEAGKWSNFQRNQDKKNYQYKPFLKWFLQEVQKEEKKTGQKLLDVVDVHYYPMQKNVFQEKFDGKDTMRLRFNSLLGLWNEHYVDESWIAEPIALLPTLTEWKNEVNSTLKISIGEYNFKGDHDISGAISQAEALALFAENDVYSAHMWTTPTKGSFTSAGFKLMRNFDSKNSTFESHLLLTQYPRGRDFYSLGSISEDKSRVTVLLTNKNFQQTKTIELRLPTALQGGWNVHSFCIDEDSPQIVQKQTFQIEGKNGHNFELKKLSACMLEYLKKD